jgi:predicted small metal-binding protein
MRTIECNECGEPLTAADDDELARNLAAHLKSVHDREVDEVEVAETVASEAYEAMDS